LQNRNFRLFATGQLFSMTGAWMQRIAQDWLVLTLTGSAAAVGIATALQFLPTLLFGLVGGAIADRYPKRRVLLATQVGLATMAGSLAILTLSGVVTPGQVYVIAFGLGVVTAVDNPTRQAFVTEMVGPDRLRNAISINSSVFQCGGLIGPAASGLLINAIGPGWSFALNAVSYAAPMISLGLMRERELMTTDRRHGYEATPRRHIREAARQPRILWPIVIVGVFGMFTANLPVTLAAYAKSVFDAGPGLYGVLSAVLALGSVAGALVSARQTTTRLRTLFAFGSALATLCVVASALPGRAAFCVLLFGIGATTLLLLTSANSTVQIAAPDAMRGRIMGLYLLVFIGGAAIGGPVIGFVDQHLGPRYGMLMAGAIPALTIAVIAARLMVTAEMPLQWHIPDRSRLSTVLDSERSKARRISTDGGTPWRHWRYSVARAPSGARFSRRR
jgi:MFS family permease